MIKSGVDPVTLEILCNQGCPGRGAENGKQTGSLLATMDYPFSRP